MGITADVQIYEFALLNKNKKKKILGMRNKMVKRRGQNFIIFIKKNLMHYKKKTVSKARLKRTWLLLISPCKRKKKPGILVLYLQVNLFIHINYCWRCLNSRTVFTHCKEGRRMEGERNWKIKLKKKKMIRM